MTQDMTKDMTSHAIAKQLVRNWRTPVRLEAHSSALTSALTGGQYLYSNDITARASRDYVLSLTRFLCPFSCKRAKFERRLFLVLLLMLFLGVHAAWGTDITTAEQLNAISSNGDYVIKADITIPESGYTTKASFTGTLTAAVKDDGTYYTISGLKCPLFTTATGATISNIMFKSIAVSGSGSVGAICGTANGATRIYNCGILPALNNITYDAKGVYSGFGSTVSSSNGNCGGLVGTLAGTARVINCFSYANIIGGSTVAGVVGDIGYDENTSITQNNVSSMTMVVNCMFYGDITGGSNIAPVYGGATGAMIKNNDENGVNPYCYFRADASFKSALADIDAYKRSWPAEEEYLTRFEYYRSILNSNRQLCTYWVTGKKVTDTENPTQAQTSADTALIAKWVLDASIAPYPILKKWNWYPSIINPDKTKTIDPRTRIEKIVDGAKVVTTRIPKWTQRSTANEYEGKTFSQSLSVTISPGATMASGGHAANGLTSKTIYLPITDMDTLNYDYGYYKVQLPYYNQIFGDASADPATEWDKRYGGNYKNYVVTGWKITSMDKTGKNAFVANWESGYNFADRDCTEKDIFSSSNPRVFAQGGFFYVPEGITSINIEAYWGKAVYLANSGNYIDRVNITASSGDRKVGQPFTPAGTVSGTFQGQTVWDAWHTAVTKLDAATESNGKLNLTVYDQAIVLLSNFQLRNENGKVGKDIENPNKWHPYTIMSIDHDLDNEPDYCFELQFRKEYTRPGIQPIRFDFLPVPELGMAVRHSEQQNTIGIFIPQGHFEITETAFMHTTQFEYDSNVGKIESPVILNGGNFEQIVVRYGSTGNNAAANRTSYFLLGGHFRLLRFTPGAHANTGNTARVRLCAVNAIGGEYPEFYLSGIYRPDITLSGNQIADQGNPHCYINGGKFNLIAGAGYDKVYGNITFKIDHAYIGEFYGGGINGSNYVGGNIDVTIDHSFVTKYCGGPKVGKMVEGKTVTTNATGTKFIQYYGGGNGGTSYYRWKRQDGNVDMPASNANGWKNYGYSTFNPLNSQLSNNKQYEGPETDLNRGYNALFEFECFVESNGIGAKPTIRSYMHWAQFGTTSTGTITNNLTDCIFEKNFYGGGNLANVSGDVTSTLTNCTVKGNAFGGGYSGKIEPFRIHDRTKTEFPYIDKAGIMHNGALYYVKDGNDDRYYTWCYKDPTTGKMYPEGVTIPNTATTDNPTFQDDGKWYVLTTVPLNDLGSVTGDVTLNIEGTTTVKGNVYGGGEESNVNGNTAITMSGGTIGNGSSGNTEHGNVFGGGKGNADNFTCDKAMIGEVDKGVTLVSGEGENATYTLLDGGTAVNITNGTVEGNVYGGGEVGRVEKNTAVTIGDGDGVTTGEPTSAPTIKGSVFGAGAGVDTHGYSALVRGNSSVTIKGNAQVWHNVYGGGENASVGRYYVAQSQSDVNTYHVPIGMPCYLKAGGKCTVKIEGEATIGKETNSGHVFGAGQGIEPRQDYDYKTKEQYASIEGNDEDDYVIDDHKPKRMTNNNTYEYFVDKPAYLQFVETLARASETDVTIDGNAKLKGSVFGGSESGFVYYGTKVEIKNGTIDSDAFGGGKGLASYSEAGRVRRNTSLTVSGGAVKGNVYGGGSLGDVGKIEKNFTNYNFTWKQNDGTTNNAPNSNKLGTNTTNTGICNVTISGGTIGTDNDNTTGNVFGAGKGLDDNFWCEKAMAYSTNIIITDGTVKGTVYGGGEIGRVEDDTKVTIGVAGAEAGGGAAPDIKGNVFGAGKGIMTHGYSALVRGNTEVTVQGNAKVGKSIYGGGEIASVGRYTIADAAYHAANPEVLEGAPYSLNNSGSGYCTVVVKDNAEIGPDNMQMINNTTGKPDDTGHVFGAGKGVLPYRDIDGNRITGDPWRMPPSSVPQTFNATTFSEAYYTELYGADYDRNKHNFEVEYFQFIETLALTTQTDVTISGNAFVKGSVYGGSENGHVQHDTHVTIAGGQIGNGDGVNRRYSNTDWASESLAECAHWEYAENGTTYDQFANEYDSKGGAKTATDGHTYYGNVFGGGSGVVPYDPGKWHRGAGSVGGNTQVDITGGHILTCVYGGNEHTDVGAYSLDDNDQPTVPEVDAGGNYSKCTINMTGGSVGVPRTEEERKLHPVTCNVFGAGKGDKRILFNTWTNVIRTEVNITGNARVYGSVFGGGEDGHVLGDAVTNIGGSVTIGSGSTATTYTHPTTITNETPGVIIGTTGTSGSDGNVFGGGRGSVTALTAGVVGGNVDLNILAGQMKGSAYGGGRLASVGTYFAMATADNYGRMQEDDPSTADVNESLLHGNITVNLIGGTIEQNVFGGCMGSRENVALGVSKNVVVNLNGVGNSEDEATQTLYTSWGLEKDNDIIGTPYVVNDSKKGCVVKGSIFGCNNLNSSPLGSVLVHVFKTQNAVASRITNPVSGEQTAKVKERYDVDAVYGGGNMAPYKPQGPGANNDTYDYKNTEHFAEVIIDGCDRTSIRQVYGGGNAASTPATKVTVNGTYEIYELFGGGNGADRISYDGGLNYRENPGANVGFYDYTEVESTYNTKEERQKKAFTDEYVYGTGTATLNVFGGLIHHVFGGSNTKGNVRQTALTLLEEKTEDGETPCCPFQVDEAYGGGKSAPMDAEAKLLMACIPGLKVAYGGAEDADIQGDVTLTITNGNFEQVFGGNNKSGRIRGSITVNIEETGCKPIIIGELYGGGNLAGYSVYGYKKVSETMTETVTNPNGTTEQVTKLVDRWLPLGKDQGDDLPSMPLYNDPVVNVKAFTSIGNVYGGGFGESAVMVGNPTVNINVIEDETTEAQTKTKTENVINPQTGEPVLDSETGQPQTTTTYLSDYAGGTVTIDEGLKTEHSVTLPSHERGKLGAIQNVYGGGNAARVVGKTTVNVGTLSDEYMRVNQEIIVDNTDVSDFYTRSGKGTTDDPYVYTKCTANSTAEANTTYYTRHDVKGVDIRGNVYGGGNQAEVTGDADVIIGKKNQ